MNFHITPTQQTLTLLLVAAMSIDALLSINGAWNYNATFYEANPIFAAFGFSLAAFTIAVLTLKALALVAFVATLAILNDEPGPAWGDMAAVGGTYSFCSLLGVLGVLNLTLGLV